MDASELISKKDLTPVHNKKSRRNTQTIYHWELERFTKRIEVDLIYDVFPSTSEKDKMTDELKAILLTRLNSEKAFDFIYLPGERDFLSIRKEDNHGIFLNFIFLQGLWVEELFFGTIRDMITDKYETIETGEIRITNN